jgi:predicted HD phosphohydrolase
MSVKQLLHNTGARSVVHHLNKQYTKYGGLLYSDVHNINILDHSLQTARWLECNANSKTPLVVSGLLHDYGYIIQQSNGITSSIRHAQLGSHVLRDLGFPNNVIMPIKLHILARRYMCSIDASYYYGTLSFTDRLELKSQGGLLTSDEMLAFEKNPYFSDSMTLLYADDLSRSQTKSIHTSIYDYKNYIKDVLKHQE